MEEFRNTSNKKGTLQWTPQIGITSAKDNSISLVLANEGTSKSQALKSEFLERCREEGFTVTKIEQSLTEEKPEKEMTKEDNTELERIRKIVAPMK